MKAAVALARAHARAGALGARDLSRRRVGGQQGSGCVLLGSLGAVTHIVRQYSNVTSPKLYHLDRFRRLKAGMVIDLQRRDDAELGELLPHLHELHPRGISHWGLHLLQPIEPTAGTNEGRGERAMRLATLASEMSLEWIRRARFSQCPSRFESLFCSASPQEARALEFDDDAPLWRLEFVGEAAAFRADMRWVSLGSGALELCHNAHRYWAGDASEDPAWELLCPLPLRVVEQVEQSSVRSASSPVYGRVSRPEP